MTLGDGYTRPLAGSAALVLIDVQRDFYLDDAPMRVEGTSAAISAMAKLAKAFRDRELPIVHVVRLYRPDGSNVDLVRRQAIEQGARIAVPGSAGSQIAAELLPNVVELDHELLLSGGLQQVGTAEHVMYKPRWGAFYHTKLKRHLRESCSNTIVFAGCNFPNCLGRRSTRLPNATSGLSWYSMRCRVCTSGASKSAVTSGWKSWTCRRRWIGWC
jgi:nicotinamidase-related amidase